MFERPKWSKVDVRLQGDPRGLSNVDSPESSFRKTGPWKYSAAEISTDDRDGQTL